MRNYPSSKDRPNKIYSQNNYNKAWEIILDHYPSEAGGWFRITDLDYSPMNRWQFSQALSNLKRSGLVEQKEDKRFSWWRIVISEEKVA